MYNFFSSLVNPDAAFIPYGNVNDLINNDRWFKGDTLLTAWFYCKGRANSWRDTGYNDNI